MPTRSEKPSQTPTDERLRVALRTQVQPLAEHLNGLTLGQSNYIDRVGDFLNGIATNGVQIFWGTKRYDQDMEHAGRNTTRRPFGIELSTLSPTTQVVLYPTTIYKPDDERRQMAKEEGFEVRESGTQVMVYFLDGFESEVDNLYNLSANLLFISHMVGAALDTRYPLEQGERSREFLQEVRAGLGIVKDYVGALPDEQKKQLAPHIARMATVSDGELNTEAQRHVLYNAEPMKMPGLYESEQTDTAQETPEQAVQNGTLYLHLDERGLPLRIRNRETRDVPVKPWVEYGRNRWNRSHQLFGRYEAPTSDGSLQLDFRLDSTHMPSFYGFFDTLEITRTTEATIREHILFGQEMGEKANLTVFQFFGARLTPEQLQDSVIPIIISGDFDFTNLQTRELLGKLATDKDVKPDIGRVVSDILRLSTQGRLQRVKQVEEGEGA